MKNILVILGIVWSGMMLAETAPIYFEGFSGCYDDEGENYGYTGGNDGLWGGDIAKAEVIYQDAPEWSFTYCNGAFQCLKVGTSKKQGSATTPAIACEGEVVLSFRAAPWEGDSICYVSIQGGTTTDPTLFHLKKNQWTTLTVRIADIQNSIRVTFSSTNKHRFFLDDVCVRPADPTVGAIRTEEGAMLDFGVLGYSYSAVSRALHVAGANLSDAGISATFADGETQYFQLSSTHLPAEGGVLTVTCPSGASVGRHGCYLYLRGKDAKTNAQVEKRVTLMMEVTYIDLEGSGTKSDPYTCADVILLANHVGTVWSNEYYWVTGYVLGGVHRYNNLDNGDYDGISFTDKQSLVLADDPAEKNEDRYVTVQISGVARAALNVVDNPELIGQQIKVRGELLNENANPLYLGKPGVRDVRTEAQYVRPAKDNQAVVRPTAGEERATKKIINGQLYIMYKGQMYNVQGKRN